MVKVNKNFTVDKKLTPVTIKGKEVSILEPIVWLLLSYQVPVTPSKKRVYVWRKLKEIGATYFKQGVAMLPRSPLNQKNFSELAKKIVEMNGEAIIGEFRFTNPGDEKKVVLEFQNQSKKEYAKVIKEIKALSTISPKSQEEARELGEKEKKLKKKLATIKAQDYFMYRKEPEVVSGFKELLKDMSSATSDLGAFISSVLGD